VSAPFGDPAYNPNAWKLGYQSRQFGVGQDPTPTGSANTTSPSGVPSSVQPSLTSPPAAMTTAAGKALPLTQAGGKSTPLATPEVVTTPSP
jgi:hypothetical protein